MPDTRDERLIEIATLPQRNFIFRRRFTSKYVPNLSTALLVFLLLTEQAAAHCPNEVSPAIASFTADGGKGSTNINTDPGCPWTVMSDAAWLTVTSAASGFGKATINYSVARNSTPGDRVGHLSVTGNLLTVTQTGVGASVSDLAISKTHAGNFVVGVNGTYRLTVTNVGSVAGAGEIKVSDTLPAGLSFVTATGAGWTCSASGSVVTCANSASLAPEAASVVVIAVAVSKIAVPGVINTATVSNASDAFPDNNTAADPTFVSSGEVISLNSGIPATGNILPDPLGVFPCMFFAPQYTIDVGPTALQVIVSMIGDPGTELLVSYGRPVGQSAFPVADFTTKSFIPTKTIYIGPQSTPALLQGTYFVSVANCTRNQTSFNLTATVITQNSAVKIEELAVDDGTAESALQGNGLVVVNRLTPSRYPSRLKAIRIYLAQFEARPAPVEDRIRLVAFSDPTSSGQPPNPPPLLVDQVVAIPGQDEFIDFPLENGPTIFSGDWYVGFQHPTPVTGAIGALVSSDLSGIQRQASFYSIDNGITFLGPAFTPSLQMNFMIRAVVENVARQRRRP